MHLRNRCNTRVAAALKEGLQSRNSTTTVLQSWSVWLEAGGHQSTEEPMLPVILLYGAAGALVTGGLFGGISLFEVASDEAAKERVRRRMAHERELVAEALATEQVRAEARRQGVDIDALQVQLHDSREAQQELLGVLVGVLREHGTSPDSVRRLLGDG
jgi:hypothetical protein